MVSDRAFIDSFESLVRTKVIESWVRMKERESEVWCMDGFYPPEQGQGQGGNKIPPGAKLYGKFRLPWIAEVANQFHHN